MPLAKKIYRNFLVAFKSLKFVPLLKLLCPFSFFRHSFNFPIPVLLYSVNHKLKVPHLISFLIVPRRTSKTMCFKVSATPVFFFWQLPFAAFLVSMIALVKKSVNLSLI